MEGKLFNIQSKQIAQRWIQISALSPESICLKVRRSLLVGPGVPGATYYWGWVGFLSV